MKILLTGVGGPSAISVWKSLNAAHELHMADMDPCAAGLYLVAPERRLIVPRGDDPRLIPVLLEACSARGIDALLPTVDAELVPVALARDDFAAVGTKIALAPVEALRLCRDKYALLNRLRNVLPVPHYELLTQDAIERSAVFPRFAKPRFGAGSRGLAKIDDPAGFTGLRADGSYLLQEYLPGEEYSVDVYARENGTVIAAVPRERLKIDSGIAVAARTVRFPELIEAAVLAVREIGIRYVANVQFKRASDGVAKLLEINPRFPGTLPLTTRAGIDIPALLVAEMAGLPLPDRLMPFVDAMMVRYLSEQFIDQSEWRHLCPT